MFGVHKKSNNIKYLGDHMKITFEDVATTVFLGIVFSVMGWAMVTAAEKERELGISGMSSERILVQDELRRGGE